MTTRHRWITPSTLVVVTLLVAACCATVAAYRYESAAAQTSEEVSSADADESEGTQYLAADSDDYVPPIRTPSAWTSYSIPSVNTLIDISMVDYNHVWLLARGRTADGSGFDAIYHYDGTSFQQEFYSTSYSLESIDVLSDGTGFAVGRQDEIRRLYCNDLALNGNWFTRILPISRIIFGLSML